MNHLDALEYLRETVAEQHISCEHIVDLQAILMADLVSDIGEIGKIRSRLLYAPDSTYVPSTCVELLEANLRTIAKKASLVHNPVEAAFFLWVSLSYLQPFGFGNACTSRMVANLPLLRGDCVPLTFSNVSVSDYALAIRCVNEACNTSAAVELFESMFQHSIQMYSSPNGSKLGRH